MKKYSLVIASNFLNHYQMALSKELMKYFRSVHFVVSEKLEEQYQKLGFSDLNNESFVIKAYENKELAKKLIVDADVVIIGSYKYMSHIYERVLKNKLVFYYSERLFKSENKVGFILRYIKYNFRHCIKKNTFLLCVSGYTADDYNRIGIFKGRAFKWGYFPNNIKYSNINEVIKRKKTGSIFWAGRLIDWKHPDDAIIVAKKLNDLGYDFSLNIAGVGPMKEKLEKMIVDNKLEEKVHLLGSMAPEKIREHMERSQIYLFTSDRGEGWGVVLNEALNSACATVASYSAGSTPFLIDDGVNGLIYKENNVEELFMKVKYLLDDSEKMTNIELNSYETINKEWNCNQAANRLYKAVENYMLGSDFSKLFEKGIMSQSYPIK